jgi:ABC-type polysaccharide/polyol phosphate export permease
MLSLRRARRFRRPLAVLPASGSRQRLSMISNWSNLVIRRNLLRELVTSELATSTAGSRLGWAWWLLDPLIMMLIYWVIFSLLLRRGGELYAPYPIFILCALVPWKHFSSCAGRATVVLRAKESLIKSVPFPTMVLPLSMVLSGAVYFLFGFAVLLVAAGIWSSPQHSGSLLPLVQAPFLILLQVTIIAGISLALSCLGVLIQDLGSFTVYVLRIGFYVSPGLYGADLVKAVLHDNLGPTVGAAAFFVYMLNPFALLFTGYRDCVFYGRFMPPELWGMLLIEAIVLLLAGNLIYQHYDRRVIKFL